MSLRVLVVPDKFKGTLTAHAAAQSIAEGWSRARPEDELELLPLSDGGDGFGEIISRLLGARPQTVRTVDAAHRPVRARWWWAPATKTAVLESAQVIGLAMLPTGKYHPFDLDTFGLGKVLSAAAERGCEACLIGIGGSATNDGGFAMARALGWRFLNQRGTMLQRWTELTSLDRIVRPKTSLLRNMKVTVAVDVRNRLLGARGASRVYGPQKGLRPGDMKLAERCLGRLAAVARKTFRKDFGRTPGAGAAGGLGFGLQAFLAARLEPGVELFARCADLGRRLRSADLVITGEGAIDRSTTMGKGVGEVACRCRKLGIPCLGFAGVLGNRESLRRHFAGVHCLTPELTTPERAMANPGFWLAKLAGQVAARWPRV